MAKLYEIKTDGQPVGVGPFSSWDEARAFQAEHCEPGRIVSYDDPAAGTNFVSNPEPQEMTASWARRFARAA